MAYFFLYLYIVFVGERSGHAVMPIIKLWGRQFFFFVLLLLHLSSLWQLTPFLDLDAVVLFFLYIYSTACKEAADAAAPSPYIAPHAVRVCGKRVDKEDTLSGGGDSYFHQMFTYFYYYTYFLISFLCVIQ